MIITIGRFVCFWYKDSSLTIRVDDLAAHIIISKTLLEPVLPDVNLLTEFLNKNLEEIYIFCKENRCFALEPAELFSASYQLRSCDERAANFIGSLFKISRVKSAR